MYPLVAGYPSVAGYSLGRGVLPRLRGTVNWGYFGQRGDFRRFQNQKITLNLSKILASLKKEEYYDIDLDRHDDILVNFGA